MWKQEVATCIHFVGIHVFKCDDYLWPPEVIFLTVGDVAVTSHYIILYYPYEARRGPRASAPASLYIKAPLNVQLIIIFNVSGKEENWTLSNDLQMTHLIPCALFFILQSWVKCQQQSHLRPVTSFWSFHELNKHPSLFPSSSDWVCLSAEMLNFPQTVYLFFVSFHSIALPLKRKWN